MSKKLKFRVSSALKNIIGKDLITDDFVAVFELVKNSYDARATNVILTFEDDAIYVADNGKGMSYEDILNKWLFVAYSAKKDGTEDRGEIDYRDKIQARKYYAGSKGVGRFSCDRLGKELTLITKTIEDKYCAKLNVEWDKFDIDQQNEFINIPIDYEEIELQEISFPNISSHGTILRIESLGEVWERDKLIYLKQSLEKLINPFSDAGNFTIEIICDRERVNDKTDKKALSSERFVVNGIIKNTILDVLQFKTTQIEAEINKNKIFTSILDRGTEIYKISEENLLYPLLENVKISLFYLNRSAKYTFTSRMGIEPVNYGSIFLFKNGFRVYPYGNSGDDSWGLDYRAQQGRARFLGTRDLFGKLELETDDIEEFKEVSSRDGGLIKTDGFTQLLNAFEKTHRRLERYVSGVLWGEGFIRREYFKSQEIALQERQALLNADRDSDSVSVINTSIGSKLDYVQIIKSLVKDENVEILFYNDELINIVSDKINELKPKYLEEIGEIADKTNNRDLQEKLLEVERNVLDLQKAKEEAEKALEEEIMRREEAEFKAQKATQARVLAEKEKEKAEKDRDIAVQQKRYFEATRNITPEAEGVLHSIKISSGELKVVSDNIKYYLPEIDSTYANKLMYELDILNFHIERINKLSKLLTKADINFLGESSRLDIPLYIKDYLQNYIVSIKDIQYFGDNIGDRRFKVLPPLDLSVILDNLVSNSKKANATKIYIDFKEEDNKIYVDFSDNGEGVPKDMIKNDSLFKIGITSSRGGSGIGLSLIKETMRRNLFGDIVFVGNGIRLKGATFRLIF